MRLASQYDEVESTPPETGVVRSPSLSSMSIWTNPETQSPPPVPHTTAPPIASSTQSSGSETRTTCATFQLEGVNVSEDAESSSFSFVAQTLSVMFVAGADARRNETSQDPPSGT